MKKNSELHLKLDTIFFQKLKVEADNSKLSLSELCRRRLRDNSMLCRIELLISDINKKMKGHHGN
jgi:hypothetical protein